MAVLTIDQGTTSTRSIVFDLKGHILGVGQQEIKQYYPQEAWIEHDPENIWLTTLETTQTALAAANLLPQQIKTIGISNQRETTILWDKKTGIPVYPAIVWQDRRTHLYCQSLIQDGLSHLIHQKTGLIIDPYFSATKIHWILNNVPRAKQLCEKQQLLFGTVETYLIWRLTKGGSHVTDVTNASRTMLFNIKTQSWDNELLTLFSIPEYILPTVKSNTELLGETASSILGASIPIFGAAGDQQAAAIGQCCFSEGMLKSTYGTGCFVLLNTGNKPLYSKSRLLTTIAFNIDKQLNYALEGSIFVAGAALQWLRDALRLISHAHESEKFALKLEHNDGVYLVPAFTGLGAPYWDPSARGAIMGLTRNTGVEHIVRAALESVCYQTKDLLNAMVQDGAEIKIVRVDGGMVKNDWLMQFLADIINFEIHRPFVTETSAFGAFILACLGSGVYSHLNDVQKLWQVEKKFTTTMQEKQRHKLYQGWKNAVNRILCT